MSNPKPQLHASALEMKCLEAFRRRYIEHEIIPPGVAAVIGTATDASITRNLSHKIETSELLSIEEITDTARDALNSAWDSGVRLEPEEIEQGIAAVKGEAADKAVRLSRLHHTELAPVILPTQVQRKWSIAIKGYPLDLVGAIDIQEGSEAIRDSKTSGKMPGADIAHRSVQLSVYSMAVTVLDGQMPRRLFLDYLVDTKKPTSKSFETTRSEVHFRAVLKRIEVIARAMEAGLFPPVEPQHWCCDPKWCGYALTCPYYVSQPVQISVSA